MRFYNFVLNYLSASQCYVIVGMGGQSIYEGPANVLYDWYYDAEEAEDIDIATNLDDAYDLWVEGIDVHEDTLYIEIGY